MIIEAILNLFKGLLFICFSWINIPSFPSELTTNINNFLDLIFNNLTLLGFFIRPTTLQVAIPILIILLNFENLYKLTMWILRKIPMLRYKIIYFFAKSLICKKINLRGW